MKNREEFLIYKSKIDWGKRTKQFEGYYYKAIKLLNCDNLRCKRVLDAASGIGVHSNLWAFKGAEVTGLDIDKDLNKIAENISRENGTSCKFIIGEVEKMPFDNNEFDICFANSFLEHAHDWQKAVSELIRVLKKGGLLILVTSNRQHPFTREINKIPFYPWYPKSLKKIVLNYIMCHKKHLVNYTDFPAINWFSYSQLSRFIFIRNSNFIIYDRLDLMKFDNRGLIKNLIYNLGIRFRFLKWLIYFFFNTTILYAVKR